MTRPWYREVCAVVLLLMCLPVQAERPSADADNNSMLRSAWHHLEQGEAALAAEHFAQVLAGTNVTQARLRAYWGIALARQSSGQLYLALEALRQAQSLIATPADQAQQDLYSSGVLRSLGRLQSARDKLADVRATEHHLTIPQRVKLLMLRGQLAVDADAMQDAVQHFAQAMQQSDTAALGRLHAQAAVNHARAQLQDKNLLDAEARLQHIENALDKLSNGDDKAQMYIALGELYQRHVSDLDFPQHWRGRAIQAFDRALDIATSEHMRGYAFGFKAALYEDAQRWPEAIQLTRQALVHAQTAQSQSQIYRWEWQLGRLYLAQAQLTAAEAAYARSAAILNGLKSDLALGTGTTFERLVEPVYTQYADVMLQRTAAMPEGAARQASLRRIRDLLETLKEAEVEDYFADECVVQNAQPGPGQAFAADTAILYPVFLDERLEIVIEAGGELRQFTTPIGRNQATQEIRRLRLNLERVLTGSDYLQPAQTLYSWLIAPARNFLQERNVQTLVLVPEGALRTIPLAALHDGTGFIIESFAVATTPAIKLTQQLNYSAIEDLFVGGLSDSVQDFPGLPNVEAEISEVSAIYPTRSVRNADFQLQVVDSELRRGDFSVAHFATHGEFNRDYRKSFILTYDQRLTLNGLQDALQNREGPPLDLLVLSACQTAAGDDRAALGLAGVAVQSGARSALASLWSISDAATAQLITEFYRQLKNGDLSKAQSLRKAQVKLLASDTYQHPSFWAPYLLIGNWL